MKLLVRIAAFFNRFTTIISNKADVVQSITVNAAYNRTIDKFNHVEANAERRLAAARDAVRTIIDTNYLTIQKAGDRYSSDLAKISQLASKGSAK